MNEEEREIVIKAIDILTKYVKNHDNLRCKLIDTERKLSEIDDMARTLSDTCQDVYSDFEPEGLLKLLVEEDENHD